MAKIFKVEGYIVDPTNDWEKVEMINLIKNETAPVYGREELFAPVDFKVNEADCGEWNDSHVLNQVTVSNDDCEQYFTELSYSEQNTSVETINETIDPADKEIIITAAEAARVLELFDGAFLKWIRENENVNNLKWVSEILKTYEKLSKESQEYIKMISPPLPPQEEVEHSDDAEVVETKSIDFPGSMNGFMGV